MKGTLTVPFLAMEDVVSGSRGRVVRSVPGGAERVVTDTRNLRGGDLFIALRLLRICSPSFPPPPPEP